MDQETKIRFRLLEDGLEFERLKAHYPSCARIFDQVRSTKEDEKKYREVVGYKQD